MLAHTALRACPLVSLRPAVLSFTLTREVVPAFTRNLADPYVTGARAVLAPLRAAPASLAF